MGRDSYDNEIVTEFEHGGCLERSGQRWRAIFDADDCRSYLPRGPTHVCYGPIHIDLTLLHAGWYLQVSSKDHSSKYHVTIKNNTGFSLSFWLDKNRVRSISSSRYTTGNELRHRTSNSDVNDVLTYIARVGITEGSVVQIASTGAQKSHNTTPPQPPIHDFVTAMRTEREQIMGRLGDWRPVENEPEIHNRNSRYPDEMLEDFMRDMG